MKGIPVKMASTWHLITGSLLILAGGLLLAGCGARAELARAQKLEAKGFYVEAGTTYERLAAAYPQRPEAPQALYLVGRIYQHKLKLNSQAQYFYTRLLQAYPAAAPWAERARIGIMDSPDYFPLTPGSFWIEGDSETGGKNMRAEWNCRAVSSGTVSIQRRVFAGKAVVTDITRYYRKENLEVREYTAAAGPQFVTLLAFPFEEGKSWKSRRDGFTVMYTVAARKCSVTVKAGSFNDCLKIGEENPAIPGSIKYTYYAPGVGWVLTTIASGSGKEHQNTELLSYKIAAE